MKARILLLGLLGYHGSAFQVQPVSSRSSNVNLWNKLGYVRTPATTTTTSRYAARVDVDERATRDMNTLQEWAHSCGVQRSDAFALGSQDGLDWSAGATTDLAKGQPILSVPNEMILSTSKAKQQFNDAVSPAVDMLTRLGAGNDVPLFYLFINILVEYEKGDSSPWYPWMNSLPRLFYNAVSMTDFCYECLPPLVFSLARTERVRFDNFCEALKKINLVSSSTLGDSAALKWAYNVATTRSFGPANDKKIVPMADMFNHGTDTEIQMDFDQDGNCHVTASRDIPALSPLRMSYGDPTNPSALFATYGFLDESSPATFCKIMNIAPTPQLKDLGLDFSRMLFYKETGGVSQEVWDVMLYSQVLARDQDTQNAFYQAHMNGDSDTKNAIHQHYYVQTCAALLKHVDTFLQQLDDLSSKGDGKDVNEHPRLPLILRHNQFVKETFLKVKANLDPVVAQVQEPVAA